MTTSPACAEFYSPDTKVNLIAHSMGGMISRRFDLKYPGKINAMITVGAPLLGGPKLIWVLETGWFLPFGAQPLLVHPSTLQPMIETFPSAHQIIPGQGWYAQGGGPTLVEDGVDLNGNGRTDDKFDYPTTLAIIDARHHVLNNHPGATTRQFRDLDFGGRQENCLADKPGVRYFHIFGQSGTADTIYQTVAGTFVWCTYNAAASAKTARLTARTSACVTCGRPDGSGAHGALRVGAAGNYNAPGARLMPCVAEATNDNVEHTAMLHNPAIQQAILQFLGEANGGPQRVIPAAQDCGRGVYTLLDSTSANPIAPSFAANPRPRPTPAPRLRPLPDGARRR